MTKRDFIDAAEVFDVWRVIPRATLFGYAYWVYHITGRILSWYERLPSAERTLETSGLAGAIITAVTGLAVWVYKIYSDNATDWSQRQVGTTRVISSDVTTVRHDPPDQHQ